MASSNDNTMKTPFKNNQSKMNLFEKTPVGSNRNSAAKLMLATGNGSTRNV
jgi:hypothetical protein